MSNDRQSISLPLGSMPPLVNIFSTWNPDRIRQLPNVENTIHNSFETLRLGHEDLQRRLNNLLSEVKNLDDAVDRRLKKPRKALRMRGEGIDENDKGLETKASWTICKICRLEEVRVVVLPCRHLCLCMECETKVDTCPVCAEKKSDCFLIMGPGEKAPPPVAATTQTSEPVSKKTKK